MKAAVKALGLFVAGILVVVLAYLGAPLITARIAGHVTPIDTLESAGPDHTIWLLTGVLHTDIALPVTAELLARFPYLQKTKLPLSHPNLKFLTFGWGSKAFYTTAGSYSDITFSATVKAITGDAAVMRVVGFGELDKSAGNIPLKLNDAQYEELLRFIDASFQKDAGQEAVFLPEYSLQNSDAFFEARGDFNIFNPCNQWVNIALRQSGARLGIWTPTTQSLTQSLRYFTPASQP